MDYDNMGEHENLSTHRTDQGDAERIVTQALTQLRDLTHLISNHLGSPVDPEDAEDVKVNKPTSKKVDVFGVQYDDGPLGPRSIPRGAAKPNKPTTMKKAYGRGKVDRDLAGQKYLGRGADREPMDDEAGPMERGPVMGKKRKPSVKESLPEMAASFKAIAEQVKNVNMLLGKLVEQEASTEVSAKRANRPQDEDEPTKDRF
jgi:hypothetical protein